MILEDLIKAKKLLIQQFNKNNYSAFEQQEIEELALLEELQLYRWRYHKAADSLIKKCNEIDDCVFYFKKKYVSLQDVCDLIQNNDFLKGDDSE